MRYLASTFGALALAFTAAVPLHADPPARVARVSYIEGSVSLRPSTADDWVQASVNYPMTSGDNIWTDQSSRAELHVGSTAMQLGPQTALGWTNLDDTHFQARLDQGEVEIRIRELYANDAVELDTPNGVVTFSQPGQYRVDVSADGQTSVVTVRGGLANVATSSQSFTVQAGQSASITGTNNATYDLASAPAYDDLDTWSQARDAREDASVSRQYVSTEMTGYEDLDSYGTWRSTPLYGEVWVPAHVRADWAPYRYGHWAYVQPWGWTWIDDAPWGFAPFHYGRWAYYGDSWVWVPGAIVARPVYAPALVAFVGGPRFSVSLRFGGDGGVAWFPLAPGEVYVPSYRVSDGYVRNVNITNVHITNINVRNINVTNIHYVNERVNGGITAVPRRVFEGAQPIARVATVVSPRDALTGTVVGHTALVAPTPASRLGRAPGDARLTVRPPAAAFTRPVAMRTADQHVVTRAPVTAIRSEPARVPVTVTRPATPSNDSHAMRAAPVQARPVKPEPAASRPGIIAVTPKQQNKPDARVGVEPHAPVVAPARPAVSRPPVIEQPRNAVPRPPVVEQPRSEVTRPPVVEQPRSEVVRPPVAAAPTRVARPEPAPSTRVTIEPRVAHEAQPREVQQPRVAQQPRAMQEPRAVQPHETQQPREVQPREAQSHQRVSTPKQDRAKDTRRPSDRPAQ
ncbi:MAG TPA: DUF6600 domain-containing protein [Gemmatimonadaceae bacterium]|nr:DUF6600 domain-containing protein [Gemmatimonadaceae bacterium]